MRKFTFLLLLLFCLATNAQVHIGNAEGTAYYYGPVNAYYGYSYIQTIYSADNINAAGDITAVTFEMGNDDAIPNSDGDLDVWIGHTSKEEFESTDDWVDVSTLTQVLTGGALSKSGTTVTITFDTPFTYNGTDNLILAYNAKEAGYDSSSDKFYYSVNDKNVTIYYRSDATAFDLTSPVSANAIKENYADITFIGITQSCPAPSDLEATNITYTSADLGWTENGSATTWNIEYGEIGFTKGSGTTVAVTEDSYSLTGLVSGTGYSFYVQTDCGSGDESSWVGPFTFYTESESVTPPYSTSFEEGLEGIGWGTEVITGNAWADYEGESYAHAGTHSARYKYVVADAADSWMFTRGLNLTAGTVYDVSFFVRGSSSALTEKLKITTGTEATSAAQTTTLLDLPNITNMEYAEQKVMFTPDTDGVYYFGFQAYSEANQYNIYVDDFKVEEHTLFSLNEDSGLGNYAYSSVDWGDYDNDGDQDILIAGAAVGDDFSLGASTTHVYDNDGSGNFTLNSGISLRGTHAGDARWVDYDSDGDLDILLLGIEYATSFTRYALYNNDGSGNFTAVEDVDTGVSWGSFAIGDYDNDGDIDYMMSGWSYGASANYSTYFFENNDNTMDREDLTSTYSGVFDGRIAWEDIDNDMDLDMIMSPDPNSAEDIKPMRVYTNEGGSFTLSQEFANNRYNAATFGDFDNDGYVDMAITGADDSYNNVLEVFKNENGIFTSHVTLGSLDGGTGTTAAFGDYDNDGDLDLVVAGTNDDYDGEAILYNNEGGVFTAATETGFIAVGAGSLAWKDADGDLDLDLQVSGFYDDPDNGEYYSRSLLYTNKAEDTNTAPEAPTSLSSEVTGAGAATFTWSGASDAQTPENGLDYYLQVGTSSGASDLASYAVRGTSWKLEGLPTTGDVYWCVKSVDTSFIESACSEEQTIENLATNDLTAETEGVKLYPNPVMTGQEVSLTGDVESVEVYAVTGQLIKSVKASSFSTVGFKPGVYFVKAKTEDGKVDTFKLIVK